MTVVIAMASHRSEQHGQSTRREVRREHPSEHEELALREVDRTGRRVDDGEAERDERVDRPALQSADDELQYLGCSHLVSPRSCRRLLGLLPRAALDDVHGQVVLGKPVMVGRRVVEAAAEADEVLGRLDSRVQLRRIGVAVRTLQRGGEDVDRVERVSREDVGVAAVGRLVARREVTDDLVLLRVRPPRRRNEALAGAELEALGSGPCACGELLARLTRAAEPWLR